MSDQKGFLSPNYTQTPNDLFEMLPDMGDAELRVTLVMIRNTFGWHRKGFKMGIGKLAAASGLSPNGARAGAEAAERRGIFRRVNPDSSEEAEWELVVGDEETTGESRENEGSGEPGEGFGGGAASEGGVQPVKGGVQPVKGGGAASEPHIGVLNKDLNKDKEKGDVFDGMIAFGQIGGGGEDPALTEFEAALGFGRLPWYSNSTWEKFRKFVIRLHCQNPQVFRDYARWREDGGKYKAFSNRKIRENPAAFMDTGYPEYEACRALKGSRGSSSGSDPGGDNQGLPESARRTLQRLRRLGIYPEE